MSTKKIETKYLILFIFTAVSINATSQSFNIKVQDNLIEIKSSSTNLPVDNIIELIKDMNQDDILIYSDYNGLMEIKDGPEKGGKTGNFQEGVAFKNGKKFEFSEKEFYLCNIDNFIYTSKIDFQNMEKKINVYQIQNNNLLKTSYSLTFPITYDISKIPNSNFLILSDIDEGYGGEIKIFDKNLILTFAYKPYENGISEFFHTMVGDYIYILTKPITDSDSNNNYKIHIINTKDNYSIKELNYEGEEPKRLLSIGDNLFLICVGKIYLFDKNCNQVWSKNLNVSYSIISTTGSESDGILCVMSEGAIVCLNLKDGTVIWRKLLEDVYPTYEKPVIINNEYYSAYSFVDYKIVTSIKMICILTAKFEQKLINGSTNVSYSNKNLTLLSFEGEKVYNIPLSTTDKASLIKANYIYGRIKVSEILVEENGFRVINDGKIVSYEK